MNLMERNGQSAIGIASLAVAAVSIVATFAVFIVAGVIETNTPGGMNEDSTGALIVGLGIFGCIGLDILSIGLGIGGIFQKTKERLCAVIGTSLGTAGFLITVFVLAAGMAMES